MCMTSSATNIDIYFIVADTWQIWNNLECKSFWLANIKSMARATKFY